MWIVLKALAKDRLNRYQSAYEMRDDLEHCAGGLPVGAAAKATAATQGKSHTKVRRRRG